MRWLWWVVGVAAFLAMLYSCALPGDLAVGRDPERSGLSGTYAINGVDPSGVDYSGTVIIVENAGAVTLEWIVTGAVHEGTGVVRGDRLEVEWQTVTSGAGEGEGTATYRIEADGSLIGTRLIDGVDTPATEEIFPEP